jgi:hypothetical protein
MDGKLRIVSCSKKVEREEATWCEERLNKRIKENLLLKQKLKQLNRRKKLLLF